jgi:hypothetical protein
MIHINTSNEVSNSYALELQQKNERNLKLKKKHQFAPLTQIQRTALYHRGLSNSCTRAIEFLFNNQGARTDNISASCAIGNVSDCFIGLRGANREKLAELGLAVECIKISAKNRYNRRTSIGTWWLEVADTELWEVAQLNAQFEIELSSTYVYSYDEEDGQL